MDEQPSLRRTRMRHPTSRWRDPDFIVVPMFGAAFIAIVALITGGSETYLYVEAQADPASRIGLCSAKPVAQCVTITQVYVECYLGDMVAVSNHTTGALMKLANYPEPPLRFWVPELSVGLFCLAVWISLYLWRRHLFAMLVVNSTA